ncbi:MAG: hypothetical protein RLZZ480_209 [Candidatus Parcubacteria bacterium]
MWSRGTNYNYSLRSNSSKYSRPRLGRFHFLGTKMKTCLRLPLSYASKAVCLLNKNTIDLKIDGVFVYESGPDRIRTLHVQYPFGICCHRLQNISKQLRIPRPLPRKNAGNEFRRFVHGGPDRIRTRCLLSANEALYQLSYGPSEMGGVRACSHIYPSSWGRKL